MRLESQLDWIQTPVLAVMILLILKRSPRSPSSASWITHQAPLPSHLISANGTTIHPVGQTQSPGVTLTLPPLCSPPPFHRSPLPLSCPFLKYGLLFLPSFVLITIIPQQDCFSSIVSCQNTFDSAFPPTWSMHNGLSDRPKMIISKPPSPTPPPPSF